MRAMTSWRSWLVQRLCQRRQPIHDGVELAEKKRGSVHGTSTNPSRFSTRAQVHELYREFMKKPLGVSHHLPHRPSSLEMPNQSNIPSKVTAACPQSISSLFSHIFYDLFYIVHDDILYCGNIMVTYII